MTDPKLEPFSSQRRFICLYPIYINAKKTVSEGRKIPKEKAVVDPTTVEIFDVLTHSGFNCLQEKAMHPRDTTKELNAQGRVRVQLKNDNGSLVNADFPTRESLMIFLGEMIPKLKTRQVAQNNQGQPVNTTGNEKQKKKKK